MSRETPIRILLVEENPGDVRLLRESLGEGDGVGFKLEVVDRLSAGLERLAKGGATWSSWISDYRTAGDSRRSSGLGPLRRICR